MAGFRVLFVYQTATNTSDQCRKLRVLGTAAEYFCNRNRYLGMTGE